MVRRPGSSTSKNNLCRLWEEPQCSDTFLVSMRAIPSSRPSSSTRQVANWHLRARDGRSCMPKPGHVERDLGELWRNAVEVIRQCLDQSGIDAGDIAVIGCAGHGNGLYALDRGGDPLLGIQSLDTRGVGIVSEWAKRRRWRPDLCPLPATALGGADADSCWRGSGAMTRRCLPESAPSSCARILSSTASPARARPRPRICRVAGFCACRADATSLSCWPPTVSTIAWTCCRTCWRLPTSPAISRAMSPLPPAFGRARLWWPACSTSSPAPSVRASPAPAPPRSLPAPGASTRLSPRSRSATRRSSCCRRSIRCATSPSNRAPLRPQISSGSCVSSSSMRRRQANRHSRCCSELVASVDPAGDMPIYHPFLYGSQQNGKARAGFYGIAGWHTRAHMLRALFEGVVFEHKRHVETLRRAGASSTRRFFRAAARAAPSGRRYSRMCLMCR